MVLGYASGTAQPQLPVGPLKLIKIPVPPLSTQRNIAAILSAYDDLIENNLRRIKILEEMAQNIYREWFVKFRFPGHRHARFTDSPLGRIPEGWEMTTLGAVSNVIPGYAFKSKDWADAGIPVIKIKNIRPGNLIDTDQVDHVPEGILCSTHKKYWLYNGDILIAMTGATAGKVGKLRSKKPMLLNQRVAKIEPKQHFKEFVWCTVNSPGAEERFYALADGAAQPNMSGGQIENSELFVPSTDLVQQFNDFVSPFVNDVDNMILRNQALRRTRDLLLPRLISGDVDVSELDIAVPEEAVT
jgi:type I restriction enzyme S subunit